MKSIKEIRINVCSGRTKPNRAATHVTERRLQPEEVMPSQTIALWAATESGILDDKEQTCPRRLLVNHANLINDCSRAAFVPSNEQWNRYTAS
jgi:hypothetical protein